MQRPIWPLHIAPRGYPRRVIIAPRSPWPRIHGERNPDQRRKTSAEGGAIFGPAGRQLFQNTAAHFGKEHRLSRVILKLDWGLPGSCWTLKERRRANMMDSFLRLSFSPLGRA